METMDLSSCELLTEDDRKELDETREALKDVYGLTTSKSIEENEVLLTSSRQQLDEALQALSNEDGLRDAYDEAMEKAPNLVDMESNPNRFLRLHGYDSLAAACSIALYWKIRKEIFGDRAFLPMVINGEGAMPKEISEAIQCGGACILSPDRSNRPILYVDRGKSCGRCCDADARCMIVFYHLQLLLDMDSALANGYVIVMVIDTDLRQSISKNAPSSKVYKLFASNAIPIRVRALHIIVFRKPSFLESAVPIWLKISQRLNFGLRTLVHYAESSEAVYGDLKQYGFVKEHLPKKLGGTLDWDDEFQNWFEWRLETEAERHTGITGATTTFTTSQTSASSEDDTLTDRKDDLNSDQNRKEEARARKRRLDAIYQRRKRQQKKADFCQLTEEFNDLQNDNALLKEQQQLLESLLKKAKEIALSCDRLVTAKEPSSSLHADLQGRDASSFGAPPILGTLSLLPKSSYPEAAWAASGMRRAGNPDYSLLDCVTYLPAAPHLNEQYRPVYHDTLLRQQAGLSEQHMLRQHFGFGELAGRDVSMLDPRERVLRSAEQIELAQFNDSILLQSALMNRVRQEDKVVLQQQSLDQHQMLRPAVGAMALPRTGEARMPTINATLKENSTIAVLGVDGQPLVSGESQRSYQSHKESESERSNSSEFLLQSKRKSP